MQQINIKDNALLQHFLLLMNNLFAWQTVKEAHSHRRDVCLFLTFKYKKKTLQNTKLIMPKVNKLGIMCQQRCIFCFIILHLHQPQRGYS